MAQFGRAPGHDLRPLLLGHPVSKTDAEHKTLRDALANDPQAKGFADLSQYTWRWPNLPSFGKLAPVLAAAVTDILGQKVSVNDGLARAERDGQAHPRRGHPHAGPGRG